MRARTFPRTRPLPGLSIPDTDLIAYADGGLDPERRAAIEGFLACNPDLAARIMQLRHQNARLRHGARPAAARASRVFRPAQLLLACVICAMAGWALAQGMDDDGPFRDLSPVPEYVDDAIRSFQVTHVRIAMASQVEAPAMDSAEIQSATHIRMPAFPRDWRLLDAQVFPSEVGPSVTVLAENPLGRRFQLFAVRADTRVGDKPVMARQLGEHAAYWEYDGAAYVLAGEASPSELLSQATLLSHKALL